MGLILKRLPQDRDELWWTVKALWGLTIPRTQVCPHHSTPFEAFAQAYFGEVPVSIWWGSRGLAGKSYLLACLSLTEAALLGAEVVVLGGSAQQSLNVHTHTQTMWQYPNAPTDLLDGDPSQFITRLKNRSWIKALMASQKSVRGPHPQRLRLDEIDEMDMDILEAAQGQPMSKNGIVSQTVMSSTWQYPNATMAAIMRRARENGWPMHAWCFRETSNPIDGWLTKDDVARKKLEMPKKMWETEFELTEPSFEGRAIDTAAVDAMWDPALGEYEGKVGENIVIEGPMEGGTYVHGVDWAKQSDYTVFTTWRTDVNPWGLVAFKRTHREPWPKMIADLNARLRVYGGYLVHDATGVGNVVDDLIDWPRRQMKAIVMMGRDREARFVEYISGIEQGGLKAPRIQWPWEEHRYVVHKDLFSTGGHPPDSFVAGSMAWSRHLSSNVPLVRPGSVTRDSGWSPWRNFGSE